MSTPYQFARGETITLSIMATFEAGENFADVTGVTATLRRQAENTNPKSRPVWFEVGDFTISPIDTNKGWYLKINSATSLGFAYGKYIADARFVMSGGDIVYMPAIEVLITEPVTQP